MDKAGKEPFLKTHANLTWDKAIDLPGAHQMKYLRQLIESRPFLSRIPGNNIILLSSAGEKEKRIEATVGQNGSWAMIYLTTGQPVQVNLDKMTGGKINAWWFYPRDEKTYDNNGKQTDKPFNQFSRKSKNNSFNPPGNAGNEDDWILVLDDASKNYPLPGSSTLIGAFSFNPRVF